MSRNAENKIETLMEAQVKIARLLEPQALISALYGQSAEEISESFREDIIGVSLCDERGRLRVLVDDFAEAIIRIADIEFDEGRRSNGWDDQTRTEMRDKAISALQAGLRRAEAYRDATRDRESRKTVHLTHTPEIVKQLPRISLRAGMIGDSLGAKIEFLKLHEIRQIFPNGVDRILPAYGVSAPITDDSQMALFTLEGLQEAAALKGTDAKVASVHRALLRWLDTQGGGSRLSGGEHGIMREALLRHKRAPGATCLTALTGSKGFGEPAHNDSKGCGTIMRVAPLAFAAERKEVRELALRTSALTHGHPTGQWAAAFWAELLGRVKDFSTHGRLDQIFVRNVAEDLLEDYRDHPEAKEVVDAVDQALASERATPEDIEGLGGGWTAETALGIALRASLVAKNFEDGLKTAVTHSGDSDSTGFIAGNLLGLIFPDEVLNHPWNSQVEGLEILDSLLRTTS